MVVIGVIDAVGLSLLGVKAALALGLLAGLLEFIPLLGPILSAVPAIAMGFLDSPQKALFVALLCWGVQFLEGHILAPLLMKRGVDLPPVVTLIGLSLMAIVFGFLGMMVAVPVLAAVMVAIRCSTSRTWWGKGKTRRRRACLPPPYRPRRPSERASPV